MQVAVLSVSLKHGDEFKRLADCFLHNTTTPRHTTGLGTVRSNAQPVHITQYGFTLPVGQRAHHTVLLCAIHRT